MTDLQSKVDITLEVFTNHKLMRNVYILFAFLWNVCFVVFGYNLALLCHNFYITLFMSDIVMYFVTMGFFTMLVPKLVTRYMTMQYVPEIKTQDN
ncbi:MAG: hypothetical protein WC346_03980 [Methanogenium sp.]|jgi:hypothetical protein